MTTCSKLLRLLLFLCLLGIDTFSAAKQQPIVKELLEIPMGKGSFILRDLILNGPTISGTVTNNTDRSWRYVSFTLRLVDRKGQQVKGLMPSDTSLQVRDLRRGDTKQLTDFGGRPISIEAIRYAKIAQFDIMLDSEHSYYDSKYVFSLVKPKESNTLIFEDEEIRIVLIPTSEQIGFILQNKTNEPILINWDQVSHIDLSGTSHRVIHQGTKLADRDKPQAATVVPPTTRIEDFVFPADHVTWSASIDDWYQLPILPPSQEAVQHKGQSFGVFMPLEVNGAKKNYMFMIQIVDVEIGP